MTGMAGDILPLSERTHPELRFVPIADERSIIDFVDLNSIAYGLPIEAGRSIVPERTLWKKHAHGFVAYKGDKPVATATGLINGNCILLLLVATAADERRKGYADAVIRKALNSAHRATGIRRTVLHATDAGAPVYLRLGYRPAAKFMGYLPIANK
jgi:GNAT superfamily N-acetyltransferase